MENRKLNMTLMRKGYGVHPERDIVILDEKIITSGNYKQAIDALSMRYIEADFIIVAEDESVDYSNLYNVYGLFDLSDEEIEYLKSMAKISCDSSVEQEELVQQVQTALIKEGFNREGTTLLAIDDDDTTRKLDF